MTTLSPSTSAPHEIEADALVLFAVPAQGSTTKGRPGVRLLGAEALGKKARTHLTETLATLRAAGTAGENVSVTGTPGVAAPLVVVAGLGAHEPGEVPSEETVRRAAGAAIRSLAGRSRVVVAAPAGEAEGAKNAKGTKSARSATSTEIASGTALAVAAAEGAAFGAYRFDRHRSTPGEGSGAPVAEVVVCGPSSAELDAALERAAVLAQEQAWARDLVNTSPNALYPASFADAVREHAPKRVDVEVLDESALEAGGFGGILGVGQGSARPPRLVTMTYRPRRKARARLAFVGKGITFDSGGLCIKPAGSMITMKCDMGGAAAVAAAVSAIARLGLPVEVTGYLCLAENMPGSNAQRPGDVVTMRGGRTVEIINTDAEGRLVMADGIALAAESDPDAIVDVATLTGAAMIALGKRTAAVMANDDDLQGELTSAATAAGESVWPMPIAEEIRSGMDSLVADLKHTGEREGGAMVAAAFLREFAGASADGRPHSWGHLDIAGPAYNEGSAHGYTPKGGTGYGVRTLVGFAESRA
ncbi:leucyl aminopeptidase [Agilicoccus flavus]|uniref:leucyl aminopeptidase n=1 Tax=Agilicoccus flavus TaxID=2775968 RepID=UPI001CF627C4|nr:leucyl aminopeptidase [Agilicoccus flavus]